MLRSNQPLPLGRIPGVVVTGPGPDGLVRIDRVPARSEPATVSAKALARFDRLVAELGAGDLELTLDTFAPIASTFSQLKREGHPFDAFTVALMKVLCRQAFRTHDDVECEL
jgi:hypothetical protein